MDWLSEDLLLLALDAGRGRLGRFFVIDYALMGAELVRLAASGRIDIADDQVVVRNPAPTGDAELDAALARIGEPASPPRPGEWVERPLPRICGRYLERLIGTGVICEQTRFRITRWRICGAARLAEARQRLDLIACSAGPVDLSQTAYAALACALGLDRLLYPGRRRRAERDRLREIAAGRWTTSPALASDSADAAAALPDASNGPDRAAIDAATLAAIRAATHAVAHAAAAATMRGFMASSPGGLSASLSVPGQVQVCKRDTRDMSRGSRRQGQMSAVAGRLPPEQAGAIVVAGLITALATATLDAALAVVLPRSVRRGWRTICSCTGSAGAYWISA